MRMVKLLAAAAVASMAAAPVVASPAASLSLSRASTASENANEVAPAAIIGVLAAAAIIGGIYVAVDSDDEADSD